MKTAELLKVWQSYKPEGRRGGKDLWSSVDRCIRTTLALEGNDLEGKHTVVTTLEDLNEQADLRYAGVTTGTRKRICSCCAYYDKPTHVACRHCVGFNKFECKYGESVVGVDLADGYDWDPRFMMDEIKANWILKEESE